MNFNFPGTYIVTSANAFSLDQSKNLMFGKGLTNTSKPMCSYNMLYQAEDMAQTNPSPYNSSLTVREKSFENIVGMEENAGNKQHCSTPFS